VLAKARANPAVAAEMVGETRTEAAVTPKTAEESKLEEEEVVESKSVDAHRSGSGEGKKLT